MDEVRKIAAELIQANLQREMAKIGLKYQKEDIKMGKFIVISTGPENLQWELNKVQGNYRVVSSVITPASGYTQATMTVIMQERPPQLQPALEINEIADAFEAVATFIEDFPDCWGDSIVDDPWHAANKLRKIARE